ncbi:hypothetical protein E8E13_003063 [Curvularia kusanoi]|uniref:Nephrocystin 3-like N-terminal domain-containing protein n=1 Tax=Curvularia kusanoi TaxID=90978 RepID=A0A9P4W7G6_CURKU|nr:hypothetical protein E8E13_003063 [Curvularia kusanoi]
MQSAFTHVRFGLMVGIGGGVPNEESDIRLGDVVVSSPHETHGGVVQYDFGKAVPGRFERTGSLNTPPTLLLNATAVLKARHFRQRGALQRYVSQLESLAGFGRKTAGPDALFDSSYDHTGGRTCDDCDDTYLVRRQTRAQDVAVFYGTIASGNQVMRSAAERDRVSAGLGGVLCFEMEAAGLMNSYPCLVIRGVCDYADSHKNERWQAYAAGAAAAYAKELLSAIPAADVMTTRRAEDAMRSEDKRRLSLSVLDQDPNKRTKIGMPSSLQDGSAKQRNVPIFQEPSRTSLNDEQKQCLLNSLRFDQIDARQMTIKTAHAKTCRWLLKSEQYLNWLDTTKLDIHHGFLWIKGKAGTGKSTLMKHALINARKTMKGHVMLSFFFNARGEDIEKSTIGTYRSLLLQLLERLPALQSVFDSLSLSASTFSADHQWNVESLKTLLEQAILSLGRSSSVVCFIDALDECEEAQVRDMIQFFERIGDLAALNSICFQVCFSSRHYPHIKVQHGLELVIEGQEGHSQDISTYVEKELKIGKSKTAQRVRAELQEKASGIFMWVVLVVNILNKESDRGQIHALQQKLREIPSDLHELFRDILTRDTHNKDGLVLCIQWVLFAKQPLSPEQLYHAILSGIDLEAVAWDHEEITEDVIKRFILDSSKGLAEATVSKESRVQFIHESVRDFLLQENALSKIWPELGSNFEGQSQDRLKQCCLDYISINAVTPLTIPGKLPEASAQAEASLQVSAIQDYPFLEYAVCNVLYHADMAEGSGMSQADFLKRFPLPRWVKLDNVFEKHEVRGHTDNVSLLYVLAEHNAANLIRIQPNVSSCLDVEGERYGCAFFAAAATDSQEAMQACIEGLKTRESASDYGRNPPEWQAMQKKVGSSLGRDFKYSEEAGRVSYAVEIGNGAVVDYLIELENFDLESRDTKGRTLLCVKAGKGSSVATRMLLDRGADANAQGGKYGNPLQAASHGGYEEVARLLLDKGANVNAQGGEYGNALQAALIYGSKEIATLLLDKGANGNAQGGPYSNALQTASAKGYIEIVAVLLDKGADVNAQGGFYGNALYEASSRGHRDIARLLLDKGANVNAQGGFYGNALLAASCNGYEDVVRLLLDKGADIDAGGKFGTALQAASRGGYREIAALLLDKGANVNAQGGYFGNALQSASYLGQKEIVALLQRYGTTE